MSNAHHPAHSTPAATAHLPTFEEMAGKWRRGESAMPAPAAAHTDTHAHDHTHDKSTLWNKIWANLRYIWVPFAYALVNLALGVPATATNISVTVALAIINIIFAIMTAKDPFAAKAHSDKPKLGERIWSIYRWCWMPFVWIPFMMMLEPFLWHTFYPGQPDKAILENLGTWFNWIAFPLFINIAWAYIFPPKVAGAHH